MDRQWKLDIDLLESDSLLDGFTFEDIITTLHCNEPVIDKTAVKKTVKLMLESRLEDLNFLVENNMNEIIKKAKKGR